MREDERRAVRRAAVTAVGVAVGLTATTLVGVAVASMVGSGEVPARVGAAYSSPDDLPGCGTIGDVTAPAGIAVEAPAVATSGTAVQVSVASAGGESPAPLAVLVVHGPDVVARDAGPGAGGPAVVVLAACGAGPAPGTVSPPAATNAGTAGRAAPSAGDGPPLPPGDYRLVVLFGGDLPGGDLPDGGEPTYAGPALTAVSRPLTVAAPRPPAEGR